MDPARTTPAAYCGYCGVLLIAAAAIFVRLGDRVLWGDEAETALLAINITKTGWCTVCDGHNTITFEGLGFDSNASGLWTWSPWLDKYVAAGSILLFGRTSLAARLPFALIAWFTVLFTLRLMRRLGRSPEAAIVTALLLATSVPFLLHARQCRYYSLAMFTEVWLLWAYDRLRRGDIKRGALHLLGALLAQFHSSYLILPGNIAAVTLALLPAMRRDRRILWALAAVYSALGLLGLPWVLVSEPWRVAGAHADFQPLLKLGYYLGEVHFHFLPLPLLLLAGYCVWRRRSGPGRQSEPVPADEASSGPSAPQVTMSQACSTAPGDTRPPQDLHVEGLACWIVVWQVLALSILPWEFVHSRYLTPLVPIAAILIGRLAFDFLRKPVVRYAVLLLLIGTNWFAVVTGPFLSEGHRAAHPAFANRCPEAEGYPFKGGHGFGSPLLSFIRELSRDYHDRAGAVFAYLRAHGTPADEVLVPDPEFAMIFHTGMKVTDARLSVPRSNSTLPTWVLPHSASGTQPIKFELADDLLQYYARVSVRVPDTTPLGCLPDPDAHAYVTVPEESRFILYHKIRDPYSIP